MEEEEILRFEQTKKNRRRGHGWMSGSRSRKSPVLSNSKILKYFEIPKKSESRRKNNLGVLTRNYKLLILNRKTDRL